MPSRTATSPSRAKRGDQPTASVPAPSDTGDHSASEPIEAPLPKRHDPLDPLDPHDFADGGGGGGAEAFRRTRRRKK